MLTSIGEPPETGPITLSTGGSTTSSSEPVYSYSYTLDGGRVGKATYDTKIRYLYDGENVAYENFTNSPLIRYTHPLAGYGMEGCGSCGDVCGYSKQKAG
ncbi:MAG: hypothetical protein ACQESD_05475 [Thermoplasmatota archaeon]